MMHASLNITIKKPQRNYKIPKLNLSILLLGNTYFIKDNKY